MAFNSFSANAFTQNFMQGFGFIDQINANKRAEGRLADRLAQEREERGFQRARVEEADEQVRTDRRIAEETRQKGLTREQRGREANAIMAAGPRADLDRLQAYADLPEVANFLSTQATKADRQAKLEALVGFDQLQQGAGVVDPAQAAPEAEAGLTAGVQAIEPPAEQFPAVEAAPSLSARELNQLADTDPAAAVAIRDEQAAAPGPPRIQTGIRASQEAGPRGKALTEEVARQSAIDTVNNQWRSYADITDEGGDALRAQPAPLTVANYFDDRATLDADVRRDADVRMAPVVTENIGIMSKALAEAEPGSPEFRNTSRKLGESMGLKQQMAAQYSPTQNAGVNRGGVPVGNAPPALIDNIVDQAEKGLTPATPTNTDKQRVNHTILNRGVKGKRISEIQAAAAYQLYADGQLSLTGYRQYMETGQLPRIALELKSFSPKDDIWAIRADGTGFIVRQGKDTSKPASNIIGTGPLAHLNKFAKAYDSDRENTAGTDAVNGFLSSMAQNKNAFAHLDLQNDAATVQQLFQRHMELNVIKGQLNSEWRFDGDWFPDFTDRYGSFADALLGKGKFNIDVDFTRRGLEEIDADIEALTPAPAGTRQDVDYAAIAAPDGPMPGATTEQIDAALTQQGR